ncbi:15099_t:CDS:2, partial [Funneliformis caledonium]
PFDEQAYNELLNLEIFEFNQENYNNAKSIFEQEAASDNDNGFETDFEDQVFLPLPLTSIVPLPLSTSITPLPSSTSITPSFPLTSVTSSSPSTSVTPSVPVEEAVYNLDPAKKVIATVASTSQSNTENSHQAISDKRTPTDSTNIVDQDGPPKKKQRQTRRETKLEEKEFLELLVTCFEYSTSDQINQIGEALGNEWDKNQINQYISRHKHNKNNNYE